MPRSARHAPDASELDPMLSGDDAGDGPDPSHDTDGDSDAELAFGERPSKTQRKKASHDLQALGQALVEMPDSRLSVLAMPESLRDAILEYRRTRSHEGRRRQMQYIGKLMRRTDPEPLREAVAAQQLGRARDSLQLHEAEHWRAVLVADDEALARWVREHPASDLQQLRSLVRAARKDAAAAPEQRSGRAFRDLFKFIRAQLAQSEPASDPTDHDDADLDE